MYTHHQPDARAQQHEAERPRESLHAGNIYIYTHMYMYIYIYIICVYIYIYIICIYVYTYIHTQFIWYRPYPFGEQISTVYRKYSLIVTVT